MKWEEIPGYPDYEISDTGIVRSKGRIVPFFNKGKHASTRHCKPRIVSQNRGDSRYFSVQLVRDKYVIRRTVHSLVGCTVGEVAKLFHVAASTVSGIRRGVSWRHVT